MEDNNTTTTTSTKEKIEAPASQKSEKSTLKLALLYTLVGGLVISALIAVISLLFGEFGSVAKKSLFTVISFMTHALLILSLVIYDKNDSLGKRILPTTLLGVLFASTVTSTLGTWDVISEKTVSNTIGFYALVIGSAYLISRLLAMRIPHKPTNYSITATIALIAIWAVVLLPWIFNISEDFNVMYFRIATTLSVLAATSLIISAIIRYIATSQLKGKGLAVTDKLPSAYSTLPNGLKVLYVLLFVVVASIWFYGTIRLISDTSTSISRSADSYDTKY